MPGFITMAVIALLTACNMVNADQPYNENIKANFSIEFDNIVGGQNLQLSTGSYTNVSGETFSVSLLQYFISNIKVKKANGLEYTVPPDSSYFLIKEGDPETRLAKVRVPEGIYTSVSFVVGVDSLRSTMDISQRKGVLDPAGGMDDGMYWGWNSGYIFFRMEGLSPQAPLDPSGQHKFRYHIGGFGGMSAPTINNIKTITLDLNEGGIARVKGGRSSNVHVMVDIMKIFNGTPNIKIATNNNVMFSANSIPIADNYSTMFHHDHTEN